MTNVVSFFKRLMMRGGSVRREVLAAIVLAVVQAVAVTGPGAALAATFTVTNTDNTGPGSLRQAILDANANAGADTIEFDIEGAGPHTIQPASALPLITGPVIIDGYTQPGASPNTNGPELGSNAVLRIELDGTNAGSESTGLTILGDDTTVRGLVINRFDGIGIRIDGSNTLLEGNFIGVDATGTSALGNGSGVVFVCFSAGPNHTIGGTTPEARNVISGNDGAGVFIGCGATSTLVQGNFIGTDVTGTAALGNSSDGINVGSFSGSIIGGTAATSRNVISGNGSNGVRLSAPASNNLIQGNYIGTDVTGTDPLGNSGSGVFIGIPSPDRSFLMGNIVGGTASGAGNTIAHNGADGVSAEIYVVSILGPVSAFRNPVLSNSIFSNALLGIDLGLDGVSPNDVGDADTGPNERQNFPSLTSAATGSTWTEIQGSLNSKPVTTFRLELFSNSSCDPSGFGEGEEFLGSTEVTTDGSGDANFNVTMSASIPVGRFVTATATDPDGNTSEFSMCRIVTAPLCPPGQFSATGELPCQACAPGTFSDAPGATECELCDAGSIASGSGATSCGECAAGRTSDESRTTCVECSAGRYAPVPGSAACLECAPGSIASGTGSAECTACDPGTVASEPGSTECLACAAGSSSNQAATACVACEAGTFTPHAGSPSCEQCGEGTFAPQDGATECDTCPRGTFASGAGNDECEDCPPGEFANQRGSGECEECEKGSFASDAGSVECSLCEPGTFARATGLAQCVDCPPSSFAEQRGSTECENCEDELFALPGSAVCELCIPAEECPEDFDRDGIPDREENLAPNGGDGNGDGAPDSVQAGVSSFLSATQGYVTLSSLDCPDVTGVEVLSETDVAIDPDFDYPFGLFRFGLLCDSSTMVAFLHGDIRAGVFRVRLFEDPETASAASGFVDVEARFERVFVGDGRALRVTFRVDGPLEAANGWTSIPAREVSEERTWIAGVAVPEVLSVIGIDPPAGGVAGRTPFTMSGSGFAPGAIVTFDGIPATEVSVTASTILKGRTPPHPPGLVTVVVRNPDGGEAVLDSGFTYSSVIRRRPVPRPGGEDE